MLQKYFSLAISVLVALGLSAQNTNTNKFRQLGQELPTPNVYRTASGAPGSQYWQQKADYKIKIELDENTHIIYGEETISYLNNSPDHLEYLWLQLDQNKRALDSDSYKIAESKMEEKMSPRELKNLNRCW